MKLTCQTTRVGAPTSVDFIQLAASFARLALAMGAMLALAPIAVSAQTTSGNATNGATLWAANGCGGATCHALSGGFVGTNIQIINARNAGGIGANATAGGMGGFNAASFTSAQENDLAAYIATITAPLVTQTATYQTTKAFTANDVNLNTTYSALTSTVIVTQPSKGTASVTSGRTLSYVPGAGKCGTDSFTYKAQNAARSTSDRTANITITGSPSNNNFASRIGLGSASSVATSGHNCGGTFEVGEPSHATTGNSSVWWTWTAPRSGPVSIDTVGSNFDTLLGVYTGGSVNLLTLIDSNDQAAGGNQSLVNFTAVAGTTYQIAVAAWTTTDAGAITLNIKSAPAAPTLSSVLPGNTLASVAFTAPVDTGGSAITSYTATCGAVSVAGAGSPIPVTGLTNGVAVNCSVKANNTIGAGINSSALSVTPRTVPGAPTIGVVTPGNGLAVVNFTAPASDGGAAITSYTATCGAASIVGAASPITVTGLANGVPVNCAVVAVNAAGPGAASGAVSVTPIGGPVVSKKPYDLNGDLNSDLLFRDTSTGEVQAKLMNGSVVLSGAALVGAGNWTIAHVADFNNDSKADLVWRNTDGTTILWLMNGTTATASTILLGADPSWSISHVADFNNDGKADLLWRNTNGTAIQWLMDGVTVTTSTALLGVDPDWRVTHVGDFNADGKADILWRHTNGTVNQWLMNGATITAGATLLGADPDWLVTHLGDFNNDAKADILWRHTNGTVVQWIMNGSTITLGTTLLGADPGWSVSHVGDFNADGNADILWRNTNGSVIQWLMNSSLVTGSAVLLGADPNWRVSHIADYNGDGKSDLLWRNTADGAIIMWLMNGAAQLSTAVVLGPSPWRIVPLGS